MRIDPHVGVYRLALVNLLIACTADYSKHPDKAKFVHECLAGLAQVRREGVHPEDEPAIKSIEDHARQTLKDIEKEAEIHAANEAARLESGSAVAAPKATSEDEDVKDVKDGEDVEAVQDTQEEGSQTAPSAQDKQSTV